MSDKSYVDQAKEAVGAAQQKASDALGSAKDTLTGAVSFSISCSLFFHDSARLSSGYQMLCCHGLHIHQR